MIQQWEYDTSSLERWQVFEELRKRGLQGWEMCGVLQIDGIQAVYYFKRPVNKQTETLNKP